MPLAQGNNQQSYGEHDTYKVIILHTEIWRKEYFTLKQGIFLMAITGLDWKEL